ncbi:Regulator of G-protein signaling 16 (RGS16) (Retinal-specific RGS) (RGS-r) (Retinally abundant regulator of G-protein signaling), partial [Durusdinium trenchii]
ARRGGMGGEDGASQKYRVTDVAQQVKETVEQERHDPRTTIVAGHDKQTSFKRRDSLRKTLLAPFARRSSSKVGASGAAVVPKPLIEKDKEQKHQGAPGYGYLGRREHPMVAVLDGRWCQITFGVITLAALFGPDLHMIFSKAGDEVILEVILSVCLLVFLAELVVSSMYRKRYFLSFFFWLDLVGMLSLIPDIPFIWEAMFPTDVQEQENLAILRAGRLVRTGTRTTRALRLVKFVRFTRIMRIFRLIRLARSHLLRTFFTGPDNVQNQTPNKLGIRLADLLGKRVIIGLILVLLCLPYLEVATLDYSQEHGIEMLEALDKTVNETVLADQVDVFLALQPTLIELVVANETKVSLYTDLVSLNSRLVAFIPSRSEESFGIFDETDREKEQAVLNIILTLLLVVLMGLSAYFFNRDISEHVVRPIKKTTRVIRKLAGTLFLLSKEEAGADDDNLMENDFIDSVVDQLIIFFNVDKIGGENADAKVAPDDLSSEGSSTDGKSQLSAFKKASSKAHLDAIQDIGNDEIRSLSSFEAMVEDKQAVQFFKIFLTSEFAVESLMFVEQVDQYKRTWTSLSNQSTHIVNNYILETAENQVNIDHSKRTRVLSTDFSSLRSSTFDESRVEILKQLKRDNFPRFLKSKLASDFIELKKMQLSKERMLQAEKEAKNAPQPESDKKVMTVVRLFSDKLKTKLRLNADSQSGTGVGNLPGGSPAAGASPPVPE